jgi:ABC-type Na+ efflux pump permease subunit
MHIGSLSSPGILLYLIIAAVAVFLAWRSASAILHAKASDPTQLKKKLFVPLLILVVVIALFQLMSVFFKP